MVYFVTTESLETFSLRMQLIGIADPSFWTRFGVSYGLFLGALRSGATPNQMSECDSDIDWSCADRSSSLLPYRFTRCLRSDLLRPSRPRRAPFVATLFRHRRPCLTPRSDCSPAFSSSSPTARSSHPHLTLLFSHLAIFTNIYPSRTLYDASTIQATGSTKACWA